VITYDIFGRMLNLCVTTVYKNHSIEGLSVENIARNGNCQKILLKYQHYLH